MPVAHGVESPRAEHSAQTGVMMTDKPGRSDSLRKKHRAIIARSKPDCHICGEPIDYALRYPDPRCFVVDHLHPVAKGGSDLLSNKAAAHHGCNSTKRARAYAPIVRRSSTLS